jgi:uncharacterized protein
MRPPAPTSVRPTLCVLLLGALSVALAQATYVDPYGRFEAPVPAGWTDASTPDHATFTLAEPAGVIHVVAAPGAETEVVTAALGILVASDLDPDFAAAPLQATQVPLPSGTWTQRVYGHGGELVVVISRETEGLTYLVLTRATQAAFMSAVNAAVNQVVLGITIGTPEPAADLPYPVEELVIPAGGHRLVGTLTLPEGDGTHPGVILISGSGAQDRDGRNPGLPGYAPSAWLADHLTRHGLAVLRFDERGVGASGGDHASATSADLADDVEAALRTLAAHDRVDPERVGLLGHSEGGVIAAMVAARSSDVAFVVTIAGSAVPYQELVVSQVERIARSLGAGEEEVATAVAQQCEAMRYAGDGDWEGLESFLVGLALPQLEALSAAQREALGDLEDFARRQARLQVDGFRQPWMEFFLAHDPGVDWQRVRVPVLALFGDLDVQVDVDVNRPVLEAALAECGNDDVTVVVFERANHLFQAAERGGPDEYLGLEMAFLDGFLDTISDWLGARFVEGAP